MFIGKLAALTGASPKAIRLYESIGLLPPAKRQGKYWLYSEQDIVLVHMIRRGLAVGFTLKEMSALILHRQETGHFSFQIGKQLILEKRQKIAEEMNKLNMQDADLIALQEEIERTFGQPAS
ncbi:MerR family transcriptional regulator [Leeia sp. TBRC 13508]|uniref:MerR family transcriptional regulator n=1 Tax=Leeia speluncae TaxID=2884804 RepID=A0ABS8D9X2_9NEIS|nr:MerR family transcriptional regulator [Leeia speluncae]MCB6185004.1 MerR family transcriptional regulator [Leeia speluncae]